MLCKKCGRELPYAGGKFCPFCGAPVEQTGVSDETEVFTTLPEELRNAGGAPADGSMAPLLGTYKMAKRWEGIADSVVNACRWWLYFNADREKYKGLLI